MSEYLILCTSGDELIRGEVIGRMELDKRLKRKETKHETKFESGKYGAYKQCLCSGVSEELSSFWGNLTAVERF